MILVQGVRRNRLLCALGEISRRGRDSTSGLLDERVARVAAGTVEYASSYPRHSADTTRMAMGGAGGGGGGGPAVVLVSSTVPRSAARLPRVLPFSIQIDEAIRGRQIVSFFPRQTCVHFVSKQHLLNG